ncbi:MAG: hypothetical protein U5P41_07365 [Gammaproteobacteria bacterium]|nr:hypothetical protein [Gammaproteobacteria bacterium]
MNRNERMAREHKKYLERMQRKGFSLNDLAVLQLGASVAWLTKIGMSLDEHQGPDRRRRGRPRLPVATDQALNMTNLEIILSAALVIVWILGGSSSYTDYVYMSRFDSHARRHRRDNPLLTPMVIIPACRDRNSYPVSPPRTANPTTPRGNTHARIEKENRPQEDHRKKKTATR